MKWRSLEESAAAADTRPLREIFRERKALIAKYVPAEIQNTHAEVVAELKARRVAECALGVGGRMPGFTLSDHNGKAFSSAEWLERGRLVVCFIRGRWDPFCCGQMEAMNLVAGQIAEAGAVLVAISPQTVGQSYFMADQHKLRFPLLSDAGNGVARECGLAYRVPERQEAIYRRAFVNLPLANGDESWELPVPATYVVERDGTVRSAWVNEDYSERAEPLEVLAAVEGGQG